MTLLGGIVLVIGLNVGHLIDAQTGYTLNPSTAWVLGAGTGVLAAWVSGQSRR